jgi:hypothetical protein
VTTTAALVVSFHLVSDAHSQMIRANSKVDVPFGCGPAIPRELRPEIGGRRKAYRRRSASLTVCQPATRSATWG